MKRIAKLSMIVVALFITSVVITSCESIINGDELDLSDLSSEAKNALSLRAKIQRSRTNAAPSIGPPASRDELNSMRTVVKIMNGKDNAGIAIPGFVGLNLGKEEQCLSAYYVETAVVGDSVYGIGYSVHYLFRKLKRGISITNLPQVAASGQLESNKTQVIYSLQTYGVKSRALVPYFEPTFNKDFNVEGFGAVQTKVSGIHHVLADSILSSKATFDPMILPFLKPNDLKQQ